MLNGNLASSRVERAVVEDRNRDVTAEYPELRYRTEVVEREKVCGLVGVTLAAAEIAKLLSKMCLKSKALDADRIEVRFAMRVTSIFLTRLVHTIL